MSEENSRKDGRNSKRPLTTRMLARASMMPFTRFEAFWDSMGILNERLKKEMEAKEHRPMNQKMKGVLCKILELEPEELEPFLEWAAERKRRMGEEAFYLLCLDMGCGSTSFAFLKIGGPGDDPSKGEKMQPQSIFVEYKQPLHPEQDDDEDEWWTTEAHIPTMLGYDVLGRPIVGPEAVVCRNMAENFKTVPYKADLANGIGVLDKNGKEIPLQKIWEDYFGEILTKCFDAAYAQGFNLSKNNTLVVVGRPASMEWRGTLGNYKSLIAEKHKLNRGQIITISEAKAAMQYIRRASSIRRELDYATGVVIIDIGASTIDIEFLSRGRPDPAEQECSLLMAGREVDRLLGHALLKEWYRDEMAEYPGPLDIPGEKPGDDFFSRHKADDDLGMKRSEFLYRCRMIKETICDGMPASFYGMLTPKDISWMDQEELEKLLENTLFKLDVIPDEIQAYLSERKELDKWTKRPNSWYDYLELVVRYAMDTLGKNGVGDIVVTGGSCCLVGVEKHIKNGIKASELGAAGKYDLDKLIVLNRADNYESAVPYGSAYYVSGFIRHLEKLEKFPYDLEYHALKEEFENCAADILTDELSAYLLPEVRKGIQAWSLQENKDAAPKPDEEIKKALDNLTDSAIEAKVSSALFKVQKCINTAISGKKPEEDDRYAQTHTFKKTMKCINDFLSSLAQTTYTTPIELKEVQLQFSAADLAGGIENAVKSTEISADMVKGFGASLQWIFSIQGKKYRGGVLRAYDENKTGMKKVIKDALRVRAYEAIRNQHKKEDGFGLTDQIIDNLIDDINRALYVG